MICITGNGLKTTDAIANRYELDRAVRPRLADFAEYINELDGVREVEPELEFAGV